MARHGTCIAGLLTAMALTSADVYGESPMVDPPPEIQTLVLSKDVGTGSVVLGWSDGTGPFAVVRANNPNFSSPANLAYVTRSTASSTVSDVVLADGQNYYYLVSDANARTQVYGIAPQAGGATLFSDDTMIVDGVGFSATCTDNNVFFSGGEQATITSCSATQLTVPLPAYPISGEIVIRSPNGSSSPVTKAIDVGPRSGGLRTAQAHIAVDNNHNVFITDQGASDRIWKLNPTAKTITTCTTFGNPAGLPRNHLGNLMYSNHTFAPAPGPPLGVVGSDRGPHMARRGGSRRGRSCDFGVGDPSTTA